MPYQNNQTENRSTATERERESVNSGHLWQWIKPFLRDVTAREMGVEKISVHSFTDPSTE
jgi:hypothetical protein